MKIINLGILAHVDAGKTTLTESLLYTSGAIAELGSVDKGTTRTDTMNLERQRGITIQTAVASFQWEDVKVNIIDTPGHMDFLAEVYRSLSVLDGAVLLVSAKDGIQAQTRILFHALQTMKIPTIFFINKIDQEGIDLPMVYREMKAKLSSEIIVKQKVGQHPHINVTDKLYRLFRSSMNSYIGIAIRISAAYIQHASCSYRIITIDILGWPHNSVSSTVRTNGHCKVRFLTRMYPDYFLFFFHFFYLLPP